MTSDDLRSRLRTHQPVLKTAGTHRRAAVLVPFRPGPEGALEVLFTRRAGHLPTHGGQVSFPGGGLQPEESPVQGALRETHEELSIPPASVDVLGRLNDFVTITNYHVTPVVGLMGEAVRWQPDPGEVARAFTVPLTALLDEARWEQREYPWRGALVAVWHFPWEGEDIWGATGAMLRGLLDILR